MRGEDERRNAKGTLNLLVVMSMQGAFLRIDRHERGLQRFTPKEGLARRKEIALIALIAQNLILLV